MKEGDFVVCNTDENGVREYLVFAGELAQDYYKKLRGGPQANDGPDEAKNFVERQAKKDRNMRVVEVKPWIYRLEKSRRS